MAGKGIDALKLIKGRYDPKGKGKFETLDQAKREDSFRAAQLRARAKTDLKHRKKLLKLAKKIDPERTKRPTTLASSRYCLRFRRKAISQFAQLHDRLGDEMVRVDIIPSWSRHTSDLTPGLGQRLVNRLRSSILRETYETDGIVYLQLHGEHDEQTPSHLLHFHGFATGSLLRAIDGPLRNRPGFQVAIGPDGTRTGPSPISVHRQSLTDPLHALSYVVQSFWTMRDRTGPLGERVSRPRRRRLPEPAHTDVLLWLDTQSPSSITLMMGMRVIKGHLTPR